MASRSSGAAAFARRLAAPAGGGRGGYGQMALLWTLNLADGRHSLFDMAEHAGLPFAEIRAATLAAEAAGLFAAVWS